MAATFATSSSDSEVLIHPLVLLNIADHVMRCGGLGSGVGASSVPLIAGMLFGAQTGRRVEIFHSFEMPVSRVGSQPTIDEKFITLQKDLIIRVNPTFELLGWYACGAATTMEHVAIHTQFSTLNESPLFLLLNPSGVSPEARELPMDIFITDYHGGEIVLARLPYKIETTESERVTVDHITNSAGSKGSAAESSTMTQLRSSQSSLHMLSERLGVIQLYLEGVGSGAIPADRSILRQISAVATSIPITDAARFETEFAKEMNDSLAVTLLGSLTHGAQALGELVCKIQAAGIGERTVRSGHGSGSLFAGLGGMGGMGITGMGRGPSRLLHHGGRG